MMSENVLNYKHITGITFPLSAVAAKTFASSGAPDCSISITTCHAPAYLSSSDRSSEPKVTLHTDFWNSSRYEFAAIFSSLLPEIMISIA